MSDAVAVPAVAEAAQETVAYVVQVKGIYATVADGDGKAESGVTAWRDGVAGRGDDRGAAADEAADGGGAGD